MSMKIKDWIFLQLEENNITGLEWIDKQQGIFKINWTHGSNLIKKDISDRTLAKQWAKLKNKDINRDVNKLKATLRCALNSSSGLETLEKEKTYRVYRFINEEIEYKSRLEAVDRIIEHFYFRLIPEQVRSPEVDNNEICMPTSSNFEKENLWNDGLFFPDDFFTDVLTTLLM